MITKLSVVLIKSRTVFFCTSTRYHYFTFKAPKNLFIRNTSIFTRSFTEDDNSKHVYSDTEDDLYNIKDEETNSLKTSQFSFTLTDELIEKFKTSASIQEVLNNVKSNQNDMTWIHATYALFLLCELQKIYFTVNGVHYPYKYKFMQLPNDMKNSVNDLHQNKEFVLLLDKLKVAKDMDLESLSLNIQNLVKLGLSVKDKVPQILIKNFKDVFANNGNYCNLTATERFINALFNEKDLYSFYEIKDVLPVLYASIDRCSTAEDMRKLTASIDPLESVIPDEILQKYRNKVEELINTKEINGKEHKAILKIIAFLNHSTWRRQNFDLIKKCLGLLQNYLHYFNTTELLTVYEVFDKLNEPAGILNEIQRTASRHFQKMEEEADIFYDIHIKLMCCLACFCSTKRFQFNDFLERYISYDLKYIALMEYCKLLFITKTSNIKICKRFWDKIMIQLDQMDPFNYIYICNIYVTFHHKVNNFRYKLVEDKINEFIDKEIQNGYNILIPSRCASIASYVLAFDENPNHVDYFMYKINEIIPQFNDLDCFKIIRGLEIALINKSRHTYLISILNDVQRYICSKDIKIEFSNILLDCYGFNATYDKLVDQKIAQSCEGVAWSSRYIKNVTATLVKTDLLLPKVIESMCEYVVNSKYDILGFIVEKLITLCYHLGYHPESSESTEFLDIVSNILIRDERRLSALSFIQATLALCFFQKVPDALVKLIFNVEFLENIDNELANCYYKDTYPLRVRYNLMQLNRSICLDYPEKNIPWFHQSFVNDMNKYDKPLKTDCHLQLKNVLIKNAYTIEENYYTPYGYHIDFVISADDSKFAILILESSAFTKHIVQLKGIIQLKIRHLEILGYKVIVINNSVWQQLAHKERISYFENSLKYNK